MQRQGTMLHEAWVRIQRGLRSTKAEQVSAWPELTRCIDLWFEFIQRFHHKGVAIDFSHGSPVIEPAY